MGRKPGDKNRHHDATRTALAQRALGAVLEHGARVSLHELARTTDVSIPTLKHYFGDRSQVVAAALRSAKESGAPHLARLESPGTLPLEASVRAAVEEIAAAWVPFIGRLFTAGMGAGLFDEHAGPGYLDGILEPTTQALEARLRTHAERGELAIAPSDGLGLRVAALQLLSPLVVALMHQHALGGTRCRPLDMDAFVRRHVDVYLRGYAVRKSTGPS